MRIKSQKSAEFILTAVLILTAVISLALILIPGKEKAKSVTVISGGQTVKTIDMTGLSGEMILTVFPGTADRPPRVSEGVALTDEPHNTIRIAEAGVCIIDSDCRERICISQGVVSTPGVPLVCLPNRLIVVINGEKEGSVDAQTY